MPKHSLIKNLTQQEKINFLLTNRIPRRYATLFMGWFSRVENPVVKTLSLFVWKKLSEELDLNEAKKNRFNSLHDCFIRELKEGARPVEQDPRIIVSPCDAIVGAHGRVNGVEVFQAKGYPYTLMDLLADEQLARKYQDGVYVTLRLKSTMYHRFHAPCVCSVNEVNYISGDTWNVNPIALKRIEKLYCKNERAVINLNLDGNDGASLTLVPVAAILVASIRLNFLTQTLNLKYKGPNRIACNASFNKGQEMGYFQHGSTIIVFGNQEFEICDDIREAAQLRMGQPLLRRRQ